MSSINKNLLERATTNYNLFKLTESKHYIRIPSCVLEHILLAPDLTDHEKLFCLNIDASSSNNYRQKKPRSVSLSAKKLAESQNFSKSQIFNLEQSLSNKGYFKVRKNKDAHGKNVSNIIIPTLPNEIFESLAATKDKQGEHSPYDNTKECKRTYLDRTKPFILICSNLLQTIMVDSKLPPFHKVIWLHLYLKSYLTSKTAETFHCFISNKELMELYDCEKSQLCKTFKQLQKNGFVFREKFSNKKNQNKLLWKITLTLPEPILSKLRNVKDRSSAQNSVNWSASSTGVNIASEVQPLGETSLSSPCEKVSVYDPKKFPNLVNIDNNRIYNNKNIDNRSASSYKDSPSCTTEVNLNFNNSDLVNESELPITSITPPKPPLSKSKSVSVSCNNNKRLKLTDLVLTKDMVAFLNLKSGREFRTNFINQLCLKLQRKYPTRTFANQNQLLSYLAIVLTHEKHQAPLVNHETFRFAINITEEENKAREEEKRLQNLEDQDLQRKRRELEKRTTFAERQGLVEGASSIGDILKTLDIPMIQDESEQRDYLQQ